MKQFYNFYEANVVLVNATTERLLCIIPAKHKAILNNNEWKIAPSEYEYAINAPKDAYIIVKRQEEETQPPYILEQYKDGSFREVIDLDIIVKDMNNLTVNKQTVVTDIILLTSLAIAESDGGDIFEHTLSEYDSVEEFSKAIKDELYPNSNTKDVRNLKIIAKFDTPNTFILAALKEALQLRDYVTVEIAHPGHIEYIEF